MRGAVVTLIARRMASSWLLLCCVLVTTFVTASLLAALASFESQALPQALHRRLAADPSSSITVIGLVDAQLAQADTRTIGAAARITFGGHAGQLDESVWSDPLALPASTQGTRGPQADMAAPDRIKGYAALTAGNWPGAPSHGRPIPAALPEPLAAALHRGLNSVITLQDLNTGKPITLRVAGIYRQRNPAATYWNIDQIWTCGATSKGCAMTHGPIVVSPAAFGPGELKPDQASWVLLPDAGRISAGGLRPLAARIDRLRSRLQDNPSLGGLVVSTTMPQSLQGTALTVTAAESALVIGGIQLVLVGALALLLSARLLARQRDQESAVISARGAAKWHLALAGLAEAVIVGTAASLPAPLVGSKLAELLARGWLLRGVRLDLAGIPTGAALAAAIAFALCVAAMLAPVLRLPSIRMVQMRRSGRVTLATTIRAGADVALLGLALVAVWQVRNFSAAPGASSVNFVVVAAPALAVVAVSVLWMRVLSVTTRILDRAAARIRHAGATLASWQVSRRPLGQAGPVLLAVLAVTTATLAISQYESWRQSAADQAAFAVGSDVRVDTPVPIPVGQIGTVAGAHGVLAATPVVVGTNSADGADLALDPRTAGDAVLWRADMSGLPVRTVWQRITPAGPPPGLPIPGRPGRIRLTASLSASSVPKLIATATIAVQDRFGTVFQMPAGTLPADGRVHGLVALFSASAKAGYPLRLLGLSLNYRLPPAPRPGRSVTTAARLVVKQIALAGPGRQGFAQPFAHGSQLATWHPAAGAPGLQAHPNGEPVGLPPLIESWRSAGGSQQLRFDRGSLLSAQGPTPVAAEVTLTAPIPKHPIPGVATSAYLHASGDAVGDTIPLSFGASSVPVTIVAAVRTFPTVTGAGGAVVVDQAAVQDVLASRWDPPLPVNFWWLRTAGGVNPSSLPRGVVVHNRNRETAELLSDPLTAVPQQGFLAIALAVAALAALGFAVSVAARLRAGRLEGALLSALGMSRSGQTARLCAEELMLAAPAAAAGLAAGVGLAQLLIPAVTPTAATAPPVQVVLPLQWLWLIALAVAVIPVALTTIGSAGIGLDPAGRLRIAEAP